MVNPFGCQIFFRKFFCVRALPPTHKKRQVCRPPFPALIFHARAQHGRNYRHENPDRAHQRKREPQARNVRYVADNRREKQEAEKSDCRNDRNRHARRHSARTPRQTITCGHYRRHPEAHKQKSQRARYRARVRNRRRHARGNQHAA